MGAVAASRGWLRRAAAAHGARLRQDGRPALAWAARLTAASVAAWLVAVLVFGGGTPPLLAPLTALLVVQLTPLSLLASGLDRIVSVVLGVSVALGTSAVLDLHWWSLGLVIALSIVLGQVLGLRANLVEAPISAMLVLGVGSYRAEAAAGERVAETLVGAAVGVAVTLLFPPRIAVEDAGAAMRRLAEEVADLLERAGEEVPGLEPGGRALSDAASRWLAEARRLTHRAPGVGAALERAEEGRRLNLRALGTPDTSPGLRHGLESLEHSAVAVRSMFRSFVDAGADTAVARGWDDEDLGPDLRAATALVLREQAAGLRAFGCLVHAEAATSVRPPERKELRRALNGLLEAQARLTDLVLVDDPVYSELNGAMLTTVRRLLAELDLDRRLRRLDRTRRGARRRGVRHQVARHAVARRLRTPAG